MKKEVAVYVGIGTHNEGEITCYGASYMLGVLNGEVVESEYGIEKLKVCNAMIDLGDIDLSAKCQEAVKSRRKELIDKETKRHEERMAELTKIEAA